MCLMLQMLAVEQLQENLSLLNLKELEYFQGYMHYLKQLYLHLQKHLSQVTLDKRLHLHIIHIVKIRIFLFQNNIQ